MAKQALHDSKRFISCFQIFQDNILASHVLQSQAHMEEVLGIGILYTRH